MQQTVIYKAASDAGFAIREFADHPGAFGSWAIVVSHGHHLFRVSLDGRDVCLAISKKSESGSWEELRHQIFKRRPGDEELSALSVTWLRDAAT